MYLKKIAQHSLLAAGVGLTVGTCGIVTTVGRGMYVSSDGPNFCKTIADKVERQEIVATCLIEKIYCDGRGDIGFTIDIYEYIKQKNYFRATWELYNIALGNRNRKATSFERFRFETNKIFLSVLPGNEELWAKELVFGSETQVKLLKIMSECENGK